MPPTETPPGPVHASAPLAEAMDRIAARIDAANPPPRILPVIDPETDPHAGTDNAARVFWLLGDPLRMRILATLATAPLSAVELAEAVGSNFSRTYSHLTHLRRAGLVVEVACRGKKNFYALAPARIRRLALFLARMAPAPSGGDRTAQQPASAAAAHSDAGTAVTA